MGEIEQGRGGKGGKDGEEEEEREKKGNPVASPKERINVCPQTMTGDKGVFEIL